MSTRPIVNLYYIIKSGRIRLLQTIGRRLELSGGRAGNFGNHQIVNANNSISRKIDENTILALELDELYNIKYIELLYNVQCPYNLCVC